MSPPGNNQRPAFKRATPSSRGLVFALLLASCTGNAAPDGAPAKAEEPVFAKPAVHAIALAIDLSGMAQLAREPKDWVRAKLQIAGKSYPDVAVRFKGQRSLRSWAEKPALKLDFDKYEQKGRRILGLRGMTLNNMVDDPTMHREQIGALVFAALGIPAPRASYAELTVNGARFGLYALLDAVDEDLVARHFQDPSGPIYEGEYGCDLYEQDVWGFEHDGGEDPQRALLHEFARRVAGPVQQWFLAADGVIDRQRVLAYLAASTLIADFDGYRHGHNYRIYRDPGSRQWSFIPWGFDRILKQDFGVFDSQGRIAARCFDDAACRLAYVKTLRDAIERFESLNLSHVIERNEALIAEVVARDPRRPYSRKARARAVDALRTFVARRPERLRKQLGCWNGSKEVDADGDGFGCLDCDDENAAIHPRAVETCDALDNDCSGHVDDGASCGCPLERVGEASYALCSFPMSFWEAEQFCHSLGHSLARVDSVEVLKQLKVVAQARHRAEWWVGLTDQAHEGVYVWPDQKRPARGLWATGEPDHYVCGQHCAALSPGRKPGLRDLHCASPAPFICSVSPPASLSQIKKR